MHASTIHVRKPLLAALAFAAGAVAIVLLVFYGPGPNGAKASSHPEAPLISQDPTRGQHGPLRVRQPGSPGHGHDHRELHPARSAGRRAELPSLRRHASSTRSTSTTTATAAEDMTYQFRFTHRDAEPEHVPLQHRPDHLARRSELEPAADLQRHARRQQGPASPSGRRRCSAPTSRRRRTTSARARRRTTTRSRRRPCTTLPAASRSSPASATIRSSSTSARSSTWPGCARSTRSTLIPLAGGAGRGRGRALQHAHDRDPGADRAARAGPEHRRSASTRAPAGRQVRSCARTARRTSDGPWVQVSRLGEPLINEVVIPLGQKDHWNRSDPEDDAQFERSTRIPRSRGSRTCSTAALARSRSPTTRPRPTWWRSC